MQKYFKACVNREVGDPEECVMAEGSQYIQCLDNCELQLCKDEASQNCDEGQAICNKQQKWCPSYEIVNVTAERAPTLGYIPRTQHCHTLTGAFSQEPGTVVQEDGTTLGNCWYEDKETLVDRHLSGDYVYCGGNGTVCDYVFEGGFRSRDYDPRFRTWYTTTKQLQKPNWSPPYPFFTNLDLGITYSAPFYMEDEENRRQIFRGVFAVDYTFEDLNRFLVRSYGTAGDDDNNENSPSSSASLPSAISSADDTYADVVNDAKDDIRTNEETYVVIYEAAEPNYLVATSTGRSSASKVLESDETIACPDDADDQGGCIVKRVAMADLQGRPNDEILHRSYVEQKRSGYPRNLVSAKLSDEPGTAAYVSQSSFYSRGDAELNWIILVISPVNRDETDSLAKGDALFGVVCVVAGLGFLLCLAMFVAFLYFRKSRAVILADWRFTSAFLMGCALLNLSSFTFLGENTDALCLARMWSFHFLFALALSPLFVKVYRIWRLVGTPNRSPAVIGNARAVALTLPIVGAQVIILTIFSIVDPPQASDVVDVNGAVVSQSVECTSESDAFVFTMFGFECGLVLIGCVLAFITRNMDSGFGQSKELMFSMYNIAFIGLVISVVTFTMDIEMSGQIVLYCIGIFCGTVFSSAAFVLPRVVQSHQERQVLPKRSSNNKSKSKSQETQSKKPRVNFSESIQHIGERNSEDRERPETGWSEVEENDAATGAKSAGSLPEDDIWTQHSGARSAPTDTDRSRQDATAGSAKDAPKKPRREGSIGSIPEDDVWTQDNGEPTGEDEGDLTNHNSFKDDSSLINDGSLKNARTSTRKSKEIADRRVEQGSGSSGAAAPDLQGAWDV